ncbi:hypothetical protein H8D36_02580 [archaeon]|nr:hypothetical protein [archaeon]MBL7057556.1 hypothetical protein [Candidatus Woesearchaeota archaeon]
MRRLLILPILFILAISFVSAADFHLSSEAIKKDIFISEVAEFNITITNLLETSDVFTFSTDDPNWIVLTSQVEVAAESSQSVPFKIDPITNIPLGVHAINVKVRSTKTNAFKNEVLLVNIRPYDPIFGQYRPSIQFGVNIDKEVDPTKKIPVEIYMRNRNALDIGEVEILLDGTLFEQTITASIGPLEEKRTEYLFEIDPLQEPGLYSLNAQIKVKNISISSATQNYEVIGYAPTTQDISQESFFFRTVQTITLQNTGNMEKTTKVNLKMSWIERVFSNSNPKSSVVKENNEASLQWGVTIQPQEMQEIVVVTNYRLPIIIIIVIIIIIILYFIMRTPVLVSKEALISGSSEEGVEHLKIRLFVKNRSRKNIEKVNLFDRIPGIAELINKKTLGTIQPDKITKQEKRGTMVKWNLEHLEPFEERIVTYEIKSRLKIIGNISLPSTRATFLDKNKERTVYSNRVMVSN